MFSAAVNATVLFISTDYVFDGTSAPYSEGDDTNPLNDYGLSKLEAEKIVLSVNNSEFFIMLSDREKLFRHPSVFLLLFYDNITSVM